MTWGYWHLIYRICTRSQISLYISELVHFLNWLYDSHITVLWMLYWNVCAVCTIGQKNILPQVLTRINLSQRTQKYGNTVVSLKSAGSPSLHKAQQCSNPQFEPRKDSQACQQYRHCFNHSVHSKVLRSHGGGILFWLIVQSKGDMEDLCDG